MDAGINNVNSQAAEATTWSRAPWLPRGLILLLTLSAFTYAMVAGGSVPHGGSAETASQLGLLLGMTFVTTVAWQNRYLPMQSLFSACAILLVLSGVVLSFATLTGIPFGAFDYTTRAGPRLFGVLPIFVPVWVTLSILIGRGVARWILAPARAHSNYGFFVIGLSALLVAVLNLVMDAFASDLHKLWLWKNESQSAIRTLLLISGWFVSTVVILAPATPSLINKKPIALPADPFPLLIWSLLLLYLGFSLFRADLHLPSGVAFCLMGLTLAAALVSMIRGRI